jgi:ribose transport system permease protein
VSAAAVPAARRTRLHDAAWIARSGLAAWLIVAVLVVGLTIADASGFWSSSNLASVLTAMVVLGLVALGQNIVVLTGGIDLAVGSTASLGAVVTALWIDGYPIRVFPVILGVLALGAVIGAVHGWLVARENLAPFVVTLATFFVLQGLAFMITTTPTGQITSGLSNFALERTGPVPHAFSVLVVAAVVVWLLLYKTAFGRHVYAVGGDAAAARSNGVPVTRTLLLAYVLCSMLAIAAGIMLAARATIGSPTAGQGLELSAITVVVIGGTSLMGGRGRLVGTLGAVALLALIESSFTLLQLEASLTDLIRGVVILCAAAIFVARPRS